MDPVKSPPVPVVPRRILTLEERRALSRQRRKDLIRVAQKGPPENGSPIGPGHALSKLATLPDNDPFSARNQISSADAAAHFEALAELRIRPVPFPATSMISIVSDVDGSTRGRYAAYIGELVDGAGLDFGDSIWLTPASINRDDHRPPSFVGFGFFSARMDLGDDEQTISFVHSRTLTESVIEFHKGNVDHFHSLLPNGPRLVLVDSPEIEGTQARFRCGALTERGLNGSRDLFLQGVAVIGRPSTTIDARGIILEAIGGVNIPDYDVVHSHTDDVSGRTSVRFDHDVTRASGARPPRFPTISAVIVNCADEESAQNIDCIALLSATTVGIIERLRLLHDRFNVETSLITDHSNYHFRNLAAAAWRDEKQQALIAASPSEPRQAWHGTLRDIDGDRLLTTESDAPDSLTRVFPEISRDFDVAYVVPAGGVATARAGWNLLSVLSPASTRSGAGIYVAQRTMPPVDDDPARARMNSRATDFPARLQRTLSGAAQNSGDIWPLYTHLGGFDVATATSSKPLKDEPVPNPYFLPAAIDALQDAVFGISSDTLASGRVSFTRATQTYDYALMLRSLPANTTRIDSDIVEIASWTDRILDQVMPRSPAMLNGITFYCDDPARAEVRLDGRALAVGRNPADETGRCSVTVAETDLRFGVFSRLDPVRRSADDTRLDGGAWEWCGDHGILSPPVRKAASLRIALHGWHPVGSQAFSFRLRRSSGSVIGVLIETAAGGRFFFGDAALCPAEVDARYALERHAAPPGEWRTIVVPFTDLDWRAGAAPGGPMPSHQLAAITLIARDAPASFADVAFPRPRSTRLSQRDAPRYCVAGTVPHFTSGQSVDLAPTGDGGEAQSCVVDQRGAFCFTGVVAGIYRLSTETPAGRWVDRRGALTEVTGDLATIELTRKG